MVRLKEQKKGIKKQASRKPTSTKKSGYLSGDILGKKVGPKNRRGNRTIEGGLRDWGVDF